MRLVGWILLALVALVWVASELPSAPNPSAEGSIGPWRRTADGWQRLQLPSTDADRQRGTLHPCLFASLEILLTLTALVAFSTGGGDPSAQKDRGGHLGRDAS